MNKESRQVVAPRPTSRRSAWEPARSVQSIPSPAPLLPSTNPMPFRVELDIYRGPLDLLLYLVRKQELDICHIPIAPITEQYLEYLAVLQELDVNAVGDFLEVAGLLIEIKSRRRTATSRGGDRGRRFGGPAHSWCSNCWNTSSTRMLPACWRSEAATGRCVTLGKPTNCPPVRWIRPISPSTKSNCGTWLVPSAACCVPMRSSQPANIVYDETPIRVYMESIHQRLCEDGQVAFSDMFQAGMHKSAMIGIFLGRSGTGATSLRARRTGRTARGNLSAARPRLFARPGY